jgi:hypothetical protein
MLQTLLIEEAWAIAAAAERRGRDERAMVDYLGIGPPTPRRTTGRARLDPARLDRSRRLRKRRARQLGAAAMQVIQAGDARQIAKAKKVLVATRRSLYEILAEGSSEDA